jgi:phage terminase small subunit
MLAHEAKREAFISHRVAHPDAPPREAAIHAGYARASAAVQASKLLADPRVSSAIRLRTSKVAQQAGLSLESHLNSLKALRNRAVAAEQFGPAVTAEVSRGKAAGLYVERHRVEIERVKALSDDEIERLAVEMGLA